MGFHRVLMQAAWFSVLLSGMAAAPLAAQLPPPNCPDLCGNVSIPFPFGLTKACSLNDDFWLRCNGSSVQLLASNLTVTNISVQGQLDVSTDPASHCSCEGVYCRMSSTSIDSLYPRVPSFTISNTQNVIMAVGCETYAYFEYSNGSQDSAPFSVGCLVLCQAKTSTTAYCQAEIPLGLKDFTLSAGSFSNGTERNASCGYAFVVKKGWFNPSRISSGNNPMERRPLVLDWAIGNETCNGSNPICGRNSECYNSDNGDGYRCRCKAGYEGNPYPQDGCRDIDECRRNSSNCNENAKCKNTAGNFTCRCNSGYKGNGRGESGCTPASGLNSATRIALAVGISFATLLVAGSWLYLVFKQKKFIERKEKFFEQNGGLILKERLKEQGGSTEGIKILTVEELEKATKNFDERSIIGRGGFGTVYKGILPGNRVIAIKRSRTVAQSQIDQFINEIVVLSRINHKNVVKLLGCCLETKVPLLVYEFIPKGSLFKHIHYESNASPLPWEIRLRIAAEIAEAISYLHSTTIIHRDIKSANILLDNDFTAKVSDFGTSKLVPRDQKEVATVVQGTFGYLDPEYLQTNQLTEKSDVYSFGVVLVELLTGEEVFSSNRLDDEINLAIYFLSSLKEGRLFDVLEKCIVEDGNKEQIKEVVELAKRCLRLKGDERPTMKEVAMELKIIGKIEKHPAANPQSNPPEATPLHSKTSDAYKDDGVSSGTFGFDSMTNQATLGLKDGR